MIRYYNARILTADNKIINGELHTNGDKISYIGAHSKDEAGFERQIDLDGNLLMPSFKNAHTHSAMTFLRSYADDLPLREWLFDKVFPLEAKLNAEHIYTFTKLAILEYLSSGITASFDMYYEPEAYIKANTEYGFRSVLCGAVSDERKSAYVLEERYNKFNGISPLIAYKLGFHAEYTASAGLIEEMGVLANKYKAPVFMHNSETESETAECIKKYGKTPTELFDSHGIFNYGGGGFHCVYLNENDMEIFKSRGLYAVTCPASNCKLASGIAPISRMLEKGISVAIGTDGAASNNCLDMFREMFLVTALQKTVQKDASAVDANTVLDMATRKSALAMGLDCCDCLEVGKQADFIVIDLHKPNMQPMTNITKNIVYSGSKQNVKMTVIAGKILYENGEYFTGEDPEAVYAQANKYLAEIIRVL